MKIITLQLIKANSRIDDNAEDELLRQIGDAAEEMALHIMGDRTVDDILDEYDGKMPASIKQACLMLAEHLYTHRSAVSNQTLSSVPYTIDAMLYPYIRY